MWSGLFPAVNENEGLRKMELLRLKDKVIVVSGGTKGVGRTISEVCGRRKDCDWRKGRKGRERGYPQYQNAGLGRDFYPYGFE